MNRLKANRLNTDITQISLANPTMLASGILGNCVGSLRVIVEGGAGAVVTKSVGLKPRKGHPNPTVAQTRDGLVNAMGLPNPGISDFVKEIREAKESFNIPLFVSVYGYSAEEYSSVARKAAEAGADAIELNVSCPHVEKTGSEICEDPEILTDVVKKTKSSVSKPVFVKLSPNVTSIADVAEEVVRAGADGLTVANTVKAMVIDVETKMPVLGNKVGGLSGPSVKPIALRCVYDVYERVKSVPIMGCGGIATWRDAVEFLLAGACTVQVGTAVATEGTDVFRKISKGIDLYLARQNIENVKEIVGLSHRR